MIENGRVCGTAHPRALCRVSGTEITACLAEA
jgi:hypothetical protein